MMFPWEEPPLVQKWVVVGQEVWFSGQRDLRAGSWGRYQGTEKVRSEAFRLREKFTDAPFLRQFYCGWFKG